MVSCVYTLQTNVKANTARFWMFLFSFAAPFASPGRSYLPPQQSSPSNQYGPPNQGQSQPSNQYGPPSQGGFSGGSSQLPPSNQYGAPQQPSSQYGAPQQQNGFGGGFNSGSSAGSAGNYPSSRPGKSSFIFVLHIFIEYSVANLENAIG